MGSRPASTRTIPHQIRRLFDRTRWPQLRMATLPIATPPPPAPYAAGLLALRARQAAEAPDVSAAPHLLNAYVASAFEVALQAEALAAGAERLDLAPVDLAGLLGEVAAVLRPLAAAEGVNLLQDRGAPSFALQQGDAKRLRSVVFHLIARALAAEQPGGQVRVRADRSAREVCVRILSRAPDVALDTEGGGRGQGLTAAQRVLRAMGGALVLEPPRGGYQSLCLVLGAPPSAAALRAA